MKQIINPGDRYGYLEVVEELDNHISSGGRKCRKFKFKCTLCSELTIKKLPAVREGRVVSCGCYNKVKGVKHNLSGSRLYVVWNGMKQRCYNPNTGKYPLYGGKGIKICDDWNNNPESFIEWALKNGYKAGLTIDRINSDGNYSPENCRVVNYIRQNNNTSRNNFIELFGEKKTVAQWSRDTRCVVNYETFACRIKRGWNPLLALTTPKRKRR